MNLSEYTKCLFWPVELSVVDTLYSIAINFYECVKKITKFCAIEKYSKKKTSEIDIKW